MPVDFSVANSNPVCHLPNEKQASDKGTWTVKEIFKILMKLTLSSNNTFRFLGRNLQGAESYFLDLQAVVAFPKFLAGHFHGI